jgi:cyanophycinase-like exopeptidase
MGPVGLHGGAEFLPGDEPFLDALLRAGAAITGAVDDGGVTTPRPVRIVLVPTAAARGRPDQAAATGRAAFERRAAVLGIPVEIDVAMIVDAASAADERQAELLRLADLVYLPGGDPDIAPHLLDGSVAGRALRTARDGGTVVAGASAGAMALADWSWTPKGGIPGLGFVHGLAVVPHYDEIRRLSWQAGLARVAPDGLGYLGLDERTGVISEADGWRVAGRGAAHWFARGTNEAIVARDGSLLRFA